MRKVLSVLGLVAGLASPALAQTDANPYAGEVRAQFNQIQDLILKSAEKIGDDLYAFKPSPDVRSMAALIGHIADGNRLLCRIADGEKVDFAALMKNLDSIRIHEKKTAKADLIAALKESRGFCDAALAKLTDENGRAAVTFFGMTKPKLGMFAFNNSHNWEHYGNLVTYMRLKGIVPPSSERAAPPPPPPAR